MSLTIMTWPSTSTPAPIPYTGMVKSSRMILQTSGGTASTPRQPRAALRVIDVVTSGQVRPASLTARRGSPRRVGTWELTSASNCTTFQARRLRVRERTADGTVRPPGHADGTLVAIPRTIIAILENHQQADGSCRSRAALQPILGGREPPPRGRRTRPTTSTARPDGSHPGGNWHRRSLAADPGATTPGVEGSSHGRQPAADAPGPARRRTSPGRLGSCPTTSGCAPAGTSRSTSTPRSPCPTTSRWWAPTWTGRCCDRTLAVGARSLAAIPRLADAGVELVYVTGRPPRWLRPIIAQTGHPGMAVCANGAMVVDLAEERLVRRTTIDPDLVPRPPRAARCASWSPGSPSRWSGYRRRPRGPRPDQPDRGRHRGRLRTAVGSEPGVQSGDVPS